LLAGYLVVQTAAYWAVKKAEMMVEMKVDY
jgi:hypothetical protein